MQAEAADTEECCYYALYVTGGEAFACLSKGYGCRHSPQNVEI